MISLKKAKKIIFNIRKFVKERSELRELISSQNSEEIQTHDEDLYGSHYKDNRIFTNTRGNSYGNYSTHDIKGDINVWYQKL